MQRLLFEADFDAFVEDLCKPYYAETMGARSISPFSCKAIAVKSPPICASSPIVTCMYWYCSTSMSRMVTS